MSALERFIAYQAENVGHADEEARLEWECLIAEMQDENAKLRELLADTLIDPRDYCAKYGIDYDGWNSANDDIERRLRELGIEVDE